MMCYGITVWYMQRIQVSALVFATINITRVYIFRRLRFLVTSLYDQQLAYTSIGLLAAWMKVALWQRAIKPTLKHSVQQSSWHHKGWTSELSDSLVTSFALVFCGYNTRVSGETAAIFDSFFRSLFLSSTYLPLLTFALQFMGFLWRII